MLKSDKVIPLSDFFLFKNRPSGLIKINNIFFTFISLIFCILLMEFFEQYKGL